VSRIARHDFATWADYYSAYQRELARRFLIPFLADNGIGLGGRSVLDVGCGDGGVTAAFAEVADRCVGVDIGDFPWEAEGNLEFVKGDILDQGLADSLAGRFDLVLLRDVVEHIEDKDLLMRHVARAIRGAGHVLVTFPPYYSPFGAHQQVELRGSRLRHLPYLHLHPRLRHIARTRMTVGGFERLALTTGFRIAARTLYVSRPSFELRYGLATLRFPFPWLVGIRELVSTGAYYVLAWEPAHDSRPTAPETA